MKNIFTFCLIVIFSIGLLLGQNQPPVYQMKALGTNIGTVAIKQKTDGADLYYQHETLMEFDLLIKEYKVLIENKTHYRNGQLLTTQNKVLVNGKVNSYSNVEWKEDHYEIDIDGEKKPDQYEPIRNSGSTLYFQEPVSSNKTFSESSGNFMSIESLQEGKYKIADPETSRKMIFYYDGGIPMKVEIKHPVFTVSLIREDAP